MFAACLPLPVPETLDFTAFRDSGKFFQQVSRNFLLCNKKQTSECAKGAAKASCAETVVQNGVFGESVSSLPPFSLKHLQGPENLKGAE